MEEKYFYPKLKQISEMKELVQDALQEHKETKEFLAQLEKIGAEASRVAGNLQPDAARHSTSRPG